VAASTEVMISPGCGVYLWSFAGQAMELPRSDGFWFGPRCRPSPPWHRAARIATAYPTDASRCSARCHQDGVNAVESASAAQPERGCACCRAL